MSDEELLARPVAGANHANWQIGHVIGAEWRMMKAGGATMPELPAGFAEKYKKDTAKLDGAEHFATKEELLATWEMVRAGTIAYVKGLPAEKLSEKGPMPFTPTMADLFEAQMGHAGMHLGQIQVLRRKLGKAVMF